MPPKSCVRNDVGLSESTLSARFAPLLDKAFTIASIFEPCLGLPYFEADEPCSSNVGEKKLEDDCPVGPIEDP